MKFCSFIGQICSNNSNNSDAIIAVIIDRENSTFLALIIAHFLHLSDSTKFLRVCLIMFEI
jgi:hypothetical protein